MYHLVPYKVVVKTRLVVDLQEHRHHATLQVVTDRHDAEYLILVI